MTRTLASLSAPARVVLSCGWASVALAACSGGGPPAASALVGEDVGETDAATGIELACPRETSEASSADTLSAVLLSLPGEDVATPFRCLRFLDADFGGHGDETTLVDIRLARVEGEPQPARVLRMPLHEIKTKGFLRDRRIAILSDGKRYAALEEECPDIRAAGVAGVFAVVADYGRMSLPSDEPAPFRAATMTPEQFIAERRYGIWHVVDFSREGSSEPLLLPAGGTAPRDIESADGPGSAVHVERTLVVFDDEASTDVEQLAGSDRLVGQVFVLEGGLKGLRRYRSEAAAMAVALAGPRIDERGCSR
jgi:hypothetical protein